VIFGLDSLEYTEANLIISSIMYFLAMITSIDGIDLYSTESRRNAILNLINKNEKDFNLKILSSPNLIKLYPR